MDWWQYVLLYLGIWLLGFATGHASGAGAAIVRLAKPQEQIPTPGGMPVNPDMLRTMMQGMGGPRQ